MGNNINLSLETKSKEETDKIFKGLSAGGKITQPLQDMFWGAYFGMLTDKFGISWMVNYTKPK
jgi:PhnB protein